MLKVGDKAPRFVLLDQNGHATRLEDFIPAHNLVIFFYPKDGTPGCTQQSCTFRDRNEDFEKHKARIIGVSQDGAASHQQFKAQYHLPYPLLSDEKGELAALFGVKKTFGILPGRVTFVIDRQGIIQMVFSSQLQAKQHAEHALDCVRKLSASPV